MKKPIPEIKKDPQSALEEYLKELQADYYCWYERSERRNHRFWWAFQLLALISGFGTSLIVAALPQDLFKGGWRILLIVLPAVGSLASTVITQFSIYDLWRLREQGRAAMQDLITEGKIQLAAAKTDEHYTDAHRYLQKRVNEIETDQEVRFFAARRKEFIAKYPGTNDST